MSVMRHHLVLVRHAKSAWDEPLLADHDRPLAKRGRKALPRIREHLAAIEPSPDVVLCSSAQRTVATLDGVRDVLPSSAHVDVGRAVYEARADQLLTRLRALDADIGCAMVVGHNPCLHDLAVDLADGGDAAARSQLVQKLPTGAVVTLSFDGEWADLEVGSANLDALFTPRRPRP